MPLAEGRLALVTPWFGDDATGGAQILSAQLVHELFALGEHVDVLTTCSRSFHDDWSANHFDEGITRFAHYTVRRFRVRARDSGAFSMANEVLLSQSPAWLREHPQAISSRVADAFCAENIQSPGLLKYLADWSRRYRAIIFTPYLYGPTLHGMKLAAGRAYLQPCLHDEGYAYLPQVAEVFSCAKGLLFNSQAEYALALRLYGSGIAAKSRVVGHWVSAPNTNPHFDKGIKPPEAPYVLYVGRMDPTKNVDAVVQAYLSYRRYRPQTRLRLVLAGTGEPAASYPAGVLALGAVTEANKQALLSSCVALLQPSVNESFSRTVMEAWSYGRPVIVNGKCEATSQPVRKCGGGWAASSRSEWIGALSLVDRAGDDLLREVGQCGYRHYIENGTPGLVLQRYREILLGESSRNSAANVSATYAMSSGGRPA
jgi:glycosyltransferase involved in cell wall biosynthesis